MGRRKRNCYIVAIFAAIMAVALCTMACGKILTSNYKEAIRIAQEYLDDKYDQEMLYQDIRKTPIEPGTYHVTFTSTNPPEIEFEVTVFDSLTIPERARDFEQGALSADNYYFKLFEYLMKEHLAADANRLWGSEATVRVTVMDFGVLFTISAELSDSMSLYEMESYIENYWVSIRANDLSSDKITLEGLSCDIFEFLQILNQYGFRLEGTTFRFVSETDSIDVQFDHLSEIETVDQVIEQLEAEFAEIDE